MTIEAQFPEKLKVLFEPSRYKVLYGGRGGAKSWGVARALLIIGASKKIHVLCSREYQRSIADSVHRLLKQQIEALGLSSFYDVLNTSIKGKNGTEFSFAGIKHNPTNIKSFEGCDICWVEEAQSVSKSSWDILVPTVRKDGSEIWLTFNPELEDDVTYQRFVKDPPTDSVVVKINHSDNPWLPEVLKQEMADLRAKDEDAYLNIWEGHCRQSLEGAVYANEMRKATEEGRIMRVPYDATKPVYTAWDLGWADTTSIWFYQTIGMEFRVIDYYSNNLQPLSHYLKVMQEKPYVYDVDNLPHDAKAKTLGTGKSIEEMCRAAGRKVNIVPMLSKRDGIEAARAIFGQCYFDSEKCSDGLQALRHYRYEVDPDTKQFSREPKHDWASHGADGFRYLVVSLKNPSKDSLKPLKYDTRGII